jgi:Tropinone reductase 1
LYRFAIVEELAGFGAAVHTCSRNETKLDECIREWESKGFRVTGSVCDVSCRTQRDKLIEKVSSTFQGKLNILVCSSPHQFEAVSNLILILKFNKSS